MKESLGDRTPKNSETEEIQQFEAFMRLPLDQIPSGVAHGFASERSPSHQDLAKKGLPDEVPATFTGTLESLEPGLIDFELIGLSPQGVPGGKHHIPLEEIPSGIAHGFASGRSPSHKELAAKKNIPDEVPATFSGTLESLPDIMRSNIPLGKIPGGIAKGYASAKSPTHKEIAEKNLPDEVPATFTDTVDTLKSNLPLNKIVGGMAKGFGSGRSPSHKDLAAKENIPEEVPATFSGTVEELEYEYMVSPLPLNKIPADTAMGLGETPDPTHLQCMRMGLPDEVPSTFSFALEQFSKQEGGQTILEQKLESELEQEDQALDNLLSGTQQKFIGKYQRMGLPNQAPSTYSAKQEGGQTILEQKLESELEQEDQALDNLLSGTQQRFIGKYQRIKQDRELEKGTANENLAQSWEVIRTDKGEENIDHTGYKPARIGDEEEAEGLLDEEEGEARAEEEFGNYKVAKGKVEIKDETPLQPVEENIVIPPENLNVGINMQDLIKPELKVIFFDLRDWFLTFFK